MELLSGFSIYFEPVKLGLQLNSNIMNLVT